MSDTTYNGYTNWETWNISLWLFNEPGPYSFALAEGRCCDTVTADDAERIVLGIFPEGTPDFESSRIKREISRVDWEQIADHLNEQLS